MALNTKRLRFGIAAAGILLLAVVIGFYAYAKYKVAKEIADIPKKLGIDVQQSTQGFTFSKSEGGKTLFTISAGKAVQFKQGQRAELENVRIIVLGENDDYDQIFGKAFAYDPEAGVVAAKGEVLIDLQAQGKPTSDPLQNAEKGRVHFRTSGLSFNQKTGMAETQKKIEFSIPQASGSAKGATYDSKKRTLTLAADVRLATSSQTAAKLPPTRLAAGRAFIEDQPLRAVLHQVRMEQDARSLSADEVTVALREDNTIERIIAAGSVVAEAQGKTDSSLRAQRAEFELTPSNLMRRAVLSGTVTVHATGESPIDGQAGRAVIEFAGKNDVSLVRASEGVKFEQKGAGRQFTAVQAPAMDFFFRGRSELQRAVTAGASQLTLQQAPSNQRSVITAGGFEAQFTGKNRMQSIVGAPNARIVTITPGQPDRTISGDRAMAAFDTRSARTNAITNIEMQGSVQYKEGKREAAAGKGRFNPADDVLVLEGSPRIDDLDSGFMVSAQTIRMNRKTGEITGQRDVKATYRQLRTNANGALLAGADPIHATSDNVEANRTSGVARFTGTARLWQGANMVQAPTIVFEKDRRALTAIGTEGTRVQTVFVQNDRSGKQVPVQISSARLTYTDSERKGHFEGGVKVKVPDTTLTAARVDVSLKARATSAAGSAAASQVEEIVATADSGKSVLVEQENPVRRAAGERLVYAAGESKFVLTGGPGNPPSIFDAERGDLTGDSLTFYTRDDRVHVSSGDSSRTVTRTRIKDESKP